MRVIYFVGGLVVGFVKDKLAQGIFEEKSAPTQSCLLSMWQQPKGSH
jgi:hypothetical protein